MIDDKVPPGYTLTQPSCACETCVQNDMYECCNPWIRSPRLTIPIIWDNGGMLPAYPDPYPECQYHLTSTDIKMLIDRGDIMRFKDE